MRAACALNAFLVLAGCAATSQEVRERLGAHYVGRSSDNLVKDFGPPASTFRLQTGEMSYIWQLDAMTSIRGDDSRATAQTRYCKVSVIADPKGIVTDLKTEDTAGGGIYGSLCAQRLGIQPNRS